MDNQLLFITEDNLVNNIIYRFINILYYIQINTFYTNIVLHIKI